MLYEWKWLRHPTLDMRKNMRAVWCVCVHCMHIGNAWFPNVHPFIFIHTNINHRYSFTNIFAYIIAVLSFTLIVQEREIDDADNCVMPTKEIKKIVSSMQDKLDFNALSAQPLQSDSVLDLIEHTAYIVDSKGDRLVTKSSLFTWNMCVL